MVLPDKVGDMPKDISRILEEHKKIKQLFFPYIENRISDEDREFVNLHLSVCTLCREEFNNLVEIDNLLKISGDRLNFGETPEKVKKQRKYSGKNIKKAINTAGKLALIGGVAYVGAKAAIAAQTTKTASDLAWVSVSKAGELAGVLAGNIANTLTASYQEDYETISFDDIDDFPDDNNYGNNAVDVSEEEKDYDNTEPFMEEELLDLFYENETDELKNENNQNTKAVEDFVANDIMGNNSSDEEMFLELADESGTLSLHEEDGEDSAQLKTAIPEIIHDVQHKDLSLKVSQMAEEASENFGDVEIVSDFTDILDSFEDVEVVESLDFLDFSQESDTSEANEIKHNSTNNNSNEWLNLEESDDQIPPKPPLSLQKEMLIEEMYQNSESVPEEYKGLNLEHSYEKQEIFSENPVFTAADSENTDLSSEEESSDTYNEGIYLISNEHGVTREKPNKKILKGVAAAGVAFTLAITMWLNFKPADQQASLLNNPSEITQQQQGILSNNPVDANESSEIKPPEEGGIPSEQRRYREPLHSYSREVDEGEEEPVAKNLDAVLAEAFTRRTYEVDIRNIAWQIPEDMAANVVFKNYIMVTGQALKSALARDLASSKEHAVNNRIEIATIMDTKGNLLETKIAKSSGSNEVDKICMETFKTTVQFTKLPKIYVDRDKINANMIISF